ncbi:EP1-like glycoprotein 1 [Phragmites australis]|uniref:EP1-like glycoprotein 1 n=1 Tax=Phragmites australis TaxID=29695 RepID=UPI002D7702F6|nr:EP1-like glycoprotein 1 [Phragmites australis]
MRFLGVVLALGLLVGGLRAQPFDYPSARPSTSWANTDASLTHHVTYSDGSVARAALLRLNPAGFGPSFAFGFFCTNHRAAPCTDFLLGVAVVYCNSGALMTSVVTGIPQVVWSANRRNPVGEGATVQFTAGGDLVLKAANGKVVWSASTAGRSVAGMSINSDGNLVLFDGSKRQVWQSFDHPTDTLLVGQSLKQGARLAANSSAVNWNESRLYLTVADDSLSAYVSAKPPQRYYQLGFSKTTGAYATYNNGSLTVFARPGSPLTTIQLPTVGAKTVQYMRLEYDGHLRLYEWQPAGWAPVFEVLRLFPDDCAYPTVCGAYGVCTEMQCSCPDATNFRPVDFRRPNRGCVPAAAPIPCGAPRRTHRLVSLQGIAYFNDYATSMKTLQRVSEDACKKACLDDCACMAAQFVYGANARDGFCLLQSEVFSLETSLPEVVHYNSTMHLKVQAKGATF